MILGKENERKLDKMYGREQPWSGPLSSYLQRKHWLRRCLQWQFLDKTTGMSLWGWFLSDNCFEQIKLATSVSVTEVGDEMCWWPIFYVAKSRQNWFCRHHKEINITVIDCLIDLAVRGSLFQGRNFATFKTYVVKQNIFSMVRVQLSLRETSGVFKIWSSDSELVRRKQEVTY